MSDAAALACQRNMRDWHLARVAAAGGEVVRRDGLAWGYLDEGLAPPGAGRIVPFPERLEPDGLAALGAYFKARGAAPWCTLGAPLSPAEVRLALKRAGFSYLFPALCMALETSVPSRHAPPLAGVAIREIAGLSLKDHDAHPSYGLWSNPAACATWRAARVLTSETEPTERLLGAVAEGRLIGTLTLHRDCNGVVGIYDLATLPVHRRRGIASALLAAALAAARDWGAARIVLQNDPSLESFYAVHGFVRVGIIEHWSAPAPHAWPPSAPAAQSDAITAEDLAAEDLATAIIVDDAPRVAALIRERPELARASLPGSGASPLHLAAYHGVPGAVGALVRAGAPVAARDARFASTPLNWALHGLSEMGPVFKRGQAQAAAYLIKSGAPEGEAERSALAELDPATRARIEEAARRHDSG